MLKKFAVICMLAIFALSVVSCSSPGNDTNEEISALAAAFVNQLAEEDFTGAYASLDEKMKQELPSESELETIWKQILAQAGDYEGETGIRTDKVEGYDRAFVTSEFASATLDLIVVYNSNKEVAGFFIQPAE